MYGLGFSSEQDLQKVSTSISYVLILCHGELYNDHLIYLAHHSDIRLLKRLASKRSFSIGI